jgi:hypothetical protein
MTPIQICSQTANEAGTPPPALCGPDYRLLFGGFRAIREISPIRRMRPAPISTPAQPAPHIKSVVTPKRSEGPAFYAVAAKNTREEHVQNA